MLHLDLNADLAEGLPYDRELLQLISSANIACGLHAGSAVDMCNAVRWGKQNNVRIGAHPGFPDRENFGRVEMKMTTDELRAYLLYQLGALQAVCQAEQALLCYVKPHGALYNLAAEDETLASVIAETVVAFDPALKVMGLSGSLMLNIAQQHGLGIISEVFADRRYLPDGTLVPRFRADAMIDSDDEAIAQVLQIVQHGKLTAIDGTSVQVQADSICLHGDNAHALQFARRIRAALEQRNIRVSA
ncbi:MAG TPA: LamB/YcsF family protein [Pasteurellaceae bacterium]|nr:LamB/YcsF family protein [Pasteurellaceae bacterium]